MVVEDIERSKSFYADVLGLGIVSDFGSNIVLEGGISLQTLDTWKSFIDIDEIVFLNNAVELYFEEDDLDSFVEHLRLSEAEFIHDVLEHRWGQRVVRFRDPDGHIIEVGEGLDAVIERFSRQGMSYEEISLRMDITMDTLKNIIGDVSKE